MGPQGCGKGTQADKLAMEFDLIHVSIGDILREEVEKHGPYADIVKEAMNKGELIPEEINDKIVSNVVERYGKNIILDGYPRDMHQAEYLTNILDIDLILSLDIGDETAVERISKRLVCTGNHKVYIEDNITEKDREECRKAGGKLVKREDDTPEKVKKRLAIYHEETQPVIDYFKKNNYNVVEVNAENSVEEVYEDIRSAMNNIKK